ncbi:MAG: lipopolysaccharide biosynthesis protein [Nocardioidaceae bacterium]
MTGPQGTHAAADVGRLARGGVLNLGGAASSAVLNFLLVVAVTRALSQGDAGQFFTATSLFLLLIAIGRLGSSAALVYFVARMQAVGDSGLIRRCLRIALVPVGALSLALAALLFATADPIADTVIDGDHGQLAGFLRILAVFVPFGSILAGLLGVTRGFQEMRPTVLVEKVLRPAIQLAGVIAFASLGAGAVVVAWSFPYVPAVIAGSAWMGVLVRRHTSATYRTSDHAGLSREYWAFAVPRAIAGLLQVGMQRLDVVIVAVMLGPGPSALYVVATRLVVLGAFGTQAVSMAVQPQVAGHFARGELAAVNALYRVSTTWLMLVMWPTYLMAIVFAPTVMLLFGSAYVSGWPVLVVMCCAGLLSSACGVVDAMLTMAGKTRWIMGNVTAALVVSVSLDLLLIPLLGIIGAAWAWAAAMAVNNLLPLTQLFRFSGMHPFGRPTLLAALLPIVSYVPVAVACVVLLGRGLGGLAVASVAGTAIYAGLLWRARAALALADLLGAVRSARSRAAA